MRITFRAGEFLRLLRRANPVWLALAGVVAALIVGRMFSSSPGNILLYAGTVLQLLGVGLVAYGLSQVRRSFDRESFPAKTAAWFKALVGVFRPPKDLTVVIAESIGVSAAVPAAAIATAASDPTLEARVDALEKSVAQLRIELNQHNEKWTREHSQLRERMALERSERTVDDQRLAARLEDLAVGGLHLEMVGVVWLLLGTLFTSIPNEIARLTYTLW